MATKRTPSKTQKTRPAQSPDSGEAAAAVVEAPAKPTPKPSHSKGKSAAKPANKAPTKKKRTASKPSNTKIPSKNASTKASKPTTTKKDTGDKPLSILDAAGKVLGNSKQPMRCQEIIDQMLAKELWSTNGQTPAATLSSAIQREIKAKGKEARFKKVDRGQFTLNK